MQPLRKECGISSQAVLGYKDAVECNVHIQQLDLASNAKTCPRKAFAILLTVISSQMLDLHKDIITLRNSETSGKWDQECNFG